MRSLPHPALGPLQLFVAGLAAVVAVTGQPAAARPTAAVGPIPGPLDTPLSKVTERQPLRIAASAAPVRDASARTWQSDTGYAVGGRLVATAHRIRHTASPVLYQRARLGVRGYHIPVASPGTYFVDLFLAETRSAAPGLRRWDIGAEGREVAHAVDIAQMNGQNRAGHVAFFVPVVDGTLNLHMVRHKGLPLVGAIEVDWRKNALTDNTLFSDTFDGPAGQAPSSLSWSHDVGGDGYGNHERQYYTGRPANAALDGAGHLSITALREQYTGSDGVTRNFTSARLKTAGRFSFQYGTVEARIKVPRGPGLWPAFWALGSNFDTVGWPLCGELDVMENIGGQPRTSHATAHGGTTDGDAWQAGGKLRLSKALGRKYRTYRLVWGPSAVMMSIGGRIYSSVSTADIPPGARWNFNHSFYLLLDLAVGGDWPGPPTDETTFPAVMSVDSVTVRG